MFAQCPTNFEDLSKGVINLEDMLDYIFIFLTNKILSMN